MHILINGESRTVEEGSTLDGVLRDYGVAERGVAVAVDGAVVPRASWPDTTLSRDARIEVLSAVQGG